MIMNQSEEKSVFIEVFGEYPLIKVLDFLITFREFDYPLTEIAENSGIAWSTLHDIFPKLVELGVVIETRQIGRARLFKLNIENPISQKLIEMDGKLVKYFMEIDTEKEMTEPLKVKN